MAVAAHGGIILLLFFGLFGHNLLRYNWLWLAAFMLLCRGFAETIAAQQQEQCDWSSDEDDSWDADELPDDPQSECLAGTTIVEE